MPRLHWRPPGRLETGALQQMAHRARAQLGLMQAALASQLALVQEVRPGLSRACSAESWHC